MRVLGMRATISIAAIGAAAKTPPLPRSSASGSRTESLGASIALQTFAHESSEALRMGEVEAARVGWLRCAAHPPTPWAEKEAAP